jgi:hypothetical protein
VYEGSLPFSDSFPYKLHSLLLDEQVQISLPHLATHEAVDLCKVLHLDLGVVRFFERFVAPALAYFEDYIVLIRNINSFSIHKAMQIALSTGQSAPLHS